MESIEKLRDWCEETCGTSVCGDEINIIADEIEAEIAERYMELPTDADGVPIHVGDELCGYGRLNGGVTVSAVTGWGGIIVTDKGMTCNPAKDGLLWDGQACRHINPRTIEDVLEDFGIECDEQYPIRPRMGLIAKYADEIRELMGVGE